MKTNPDVIVVLGDRYEAFALCSAATMMGISIAHISGGDITEGAIDDTLRHCMTKMSQLHFTGCEQSRKRVIQLGENPDYVYNVGEPGVENALHEELMTRESLAENLGFDGINNDYALVTFHPATKDVDTDEALRQLEELLCAIKAVNELSYVVTLANADTGGNLINERWLQFEKECDNVKVFSSLGMKRYLSAMKYCSLVLGNSSSGIVEAPAFSVPTVNIGNRQTGRMMSESVICCDTDNNQIVSSIKRALDPDFKKSIIGVESCFGDGNTSKQIVDILVDRLNNNSLKYIKSFHDIQFE